MRKTALDIACDFGESFGAYSIGRDDAQVTGGYAKIANVISADIPLLAQTAPGSHLQFEAIDLDGAYKALEQREQILAWLRRNLTFDKA